MPSFDIVSKIDMPSVQNALDGVKKEINTRYDFKGSLCEVELQDDKIILKAFEFEIELLKIRVKKIQKIDQLLAKEYKKRIFEMNNKIN